MKLNNTILITTLVNSEQLLEKVVGDLSISDFDDSSCLTVLAAFYNHIDKQKWVGVIVANMLGADLNELGHIGAFAHPEDLPQKGRVPNLGDWEYYFHGMGCCLTHNDGTSIDVDFPEGRTDLIDPYFYENYLQSLPSPAYLQSSLIKSEPFEDSWSVDLTELKSRELVTNQHQFSLTERGKSIVKRHVALWNELEKVENCFAKAHAALLVGESRLAISFLSQIENSRLISKLEVFCLDIEERRFYYLMDLAKNKKDSERKEIYRAAASISNLYEKRVIEQVLKNGKMDSTMLFIVGLISKIDPRYYLSELEELVLKAWREKPPQPAIRVYAIETILNLYTPDTLPSSLKKKIIRALSKRLDRMMDDAAKLLYLIDKKKGLKLLTENLDSSIPIIRDNVAAILATIASPEALSILRKNGSVTAITMFAIIEDRLIAKVVPIGKEVEIGDKKTRTYTWEEIEAANREDNLRHYYEEAKESYLPLLKIWHAQECD